MASRRQSGTTAGVYDPACLGAALLALACLPASAAGTEHPTLVSVEAADCSVCHEDLIGGKAVTHPPAAEDCTSCHEMTVSEEATRVELMDEEPALCLVCHEEKSEAAGGDLDTPHFPVIDSCLTCHDPHASDHSALLSGATFAICAGCHDTETLTATHDNQVHEATDCSRCHDPHGSANPGMLVSARQHRPFADGSCNGCHRQPFGTRIRLRSRGERLCTACHGDPAESAAGGGSVHAALKGEKSKAGCLACHDPHMSDEPGLLVEAGPRLCASCHESVVEASRADSGHFPAGEDCTNCHQPHASESPHLLSAPPDELCGGCHDLEDEGLSTAHLGADPTKLGCLDCHTPHGSGHEKLMAENLHAAVEGGCETCHQGSFDRLMEDGESALCLVCHEDVGEAAAQVAVPHAALELGRCVDCHNAHASSRPRLVRSARGEFCTACHSDLAPEEGEVLHGVIDLIGCEACHEPHGGANEKLLRVTADELCVSCHDPSRLASGEQGSVRLLDRFEVGVEQVAGMASLRLSADGTRGHPVKRHLVRGTPTEEAVRRSDSTFRGEMSCLTCHDPHKGRSSKILRWDAANPTQACLHCHPK